MKVFTCHIFCRRFTVPILNYKTQCSGFGDVHSLTHLQAAGSMWDSPKLLPMQLTKHYSLRVLRQVTDESSCYGSRMLIIVIRKDHKWLHHELGEYRQIFHVLHTILGSRWHSGWGTVQQIWRSLVRFQMVSLEFFIDIILPIALWPWGRLSL
jgi:hypothetical protein